MLLEVSELAKSYGGVHAVNSCSLSVDLHEVVGLIGPNGAGKSTAVDLIAGFARPDRGHVVLSGQDVTRAPVHVRANLGLVRSFQLAHVWGRLSVLENLLVAGASTARETVWRQFLSGRRLTTQERQDRIRAREILAEFELLKLKDKPADELSGGQQRLLEFARIVMRQPQVVLLDEPSASLSPAMTERIGESIVGLANRGIAVLLIEHDLPLVDAVTSRVFCMAAGTVVAEGTMSELRRNPLVLEAYLGAESLPDRRSRAASQ
jgi:ABC-type branched-subunit amino acid transport system ATPase component